MASSLHDMFVVGNTQRVLIVFNFAFLGLCRACSSMFFFLFFLSSSCSCFCCSRLCGRRCSLRCCCHHGCPHWCPLVVVVVVVVDVTVAAIVVVVVFVFVVVVVAPPASASASVVVVVVLFLLLLYFWFLFMFLRCLKTPSNPEHICCSMQGCLVTEHYNHSPCFWPFLASNHKTDIMSSACFIADILGSAKCMKPAVSWVSLPVAPTKNMINNEPAR